MYVYVDEAALVKPFLNLCLGHFVLSDYSHYSHLASAFTVLLGIWFCLLCSAARGISIISESFGPNM